MHHWADPVAGLAELRRIARRRVVVLACDRRGGEGFWLTRDYIAENYAWDSTRFTPLEQIVEVLADGAGGGVRIEPVPVPHDCADGFLAAYWRRPAAYLDRQVRASMSNFALPGAPPCEEGLARLAADVGYRLVIADF